jgi:WD40 repeat protein
VIPDPTGRWLAARFPSGNHIRLWPADSPDGSEPLLLRRSGRWYTSGLDFHPRGEWIVASTHDQTRLTFWPLVGKHPAVVPGYAQISRPLAFSPDGRWLATGWADNVLRLWPVPGFGPTAPRLLCLPSNQSVLWRRLVFDPRGRYLVAVGVSDQAWIVPLDGSPARALPAFSASTLIEGVDVSPSGRYVAWAFGYGDGARTLRLWDTEAARLRTFDLPASPRAAASDGSVPPPKGYQGGVYAVGFADETTLYVAGDGGLRRWDLATGSHETLAPLPPAGKQRWVQMAVNRRGRALLVEGSAVGPARLQSYDLPSAIARPIAGFGSGWALAIDPEGAVAAVGDSQGVVRVGRLDAGVPHLLAGHGGAVDSVAVSPDLRWVASSGEDNTLRLWPMPDLSETPLHTLPRGELVARLHRLTNLRAVRDASAPAGWKVELGPFPGWRDVPTW